MLHTEYRISIPTIMMRYSSDFRVPLLKLEQQVAAWLKPRKAFAASNSDLRHMSQRIVDELAELEMEWQVDGELLERDKEAIDAFFLTASLNSNRQDIDGSNLLFITPQKGKRPSTDQIMGMMMEVAGNLDQSLFPVKDTELLYRLWLEYWGKTTHDGSATESLLKVLKKNGTRASGNYPSMYFNGKDPDTGRVLNPDELAMQFAHSRVCLRMIRESTGNKKTGLELHDHWIYRKYIFDFRHAEQSQRELKQLLQLTNQAIDVFQENIGDSRVSYQVASQIVLERRYSV